LLFSMGAFKNAGSGAKIFLKLGCFWSINRDFGGDGYAPVPLDL